MPRASAVVVLAALGSAAVATIAHAALFSAPRLAYVDPGSGSFVLQALVAAVAGAVVVLNAYWRRVKGLFGFSSSPEPTDDENETVDKRKDD